MSRSAYGQRECDYCGRWISNAGWAWTSHMRKHVREGLVTEKRTIDYSQGERNFGTYLRFLPTEEGKKARNVVLGERRKRISGQGLVEYAMLIVLVALIVIVLLGIFGRSVGNMFSNIISNI